MATDKELLKRITVIPGLMGGKPTIRAQRFCVSDILELLLSGMSQKQILKEHPILEIDDIKASLYYSIQQVNKIKDSGSNLKYE